MHVACSWSLYVTVSTLAQLVTSAHMFMLPSVQVISGIEPALLLEHLDHVPAAGSASRCAQG